MEYKQIDKSSYKLHLIKTNNKFKTIFFKFIFRDNIKKDDITIRNFLIDMLSLTSKKYNSSRLLSIKQEELYNLTMNFSNRRIGNQIMSEFCFSMIDPIYIDNNFLDESIAFMNEIIFNPNVINNSFDKKSFNITYDYMKEKIEEIKSYPNYYAESVFKELMGKNNVISLNLNGYSNYLEKINPENLYTYYKNFIKKNVLDIYVVGNINYVEIEKLFDKYIKLPNYEKEIKEVYNNYQTTTNKVINISENSNFSQSQLFIGCSFKNLTEKEKKYTCVLYNMILGNSPESKLFKNIREKKSLAYDITSNYFKNDNILIIKTGINSDFKDEVIESIKEELKQISLGNFSDEHLNNCKILIKSLLKEIEDYPSSIQEYYFGCCYLNEDTKEEKLNQISSITKEEIKKIAQKVVIDTIYFLKEQAK